MQNLLIVGAGPCGLAVAAAAERAGLDYSAHDRGCVVNSLTRFPLNMSFFSTAEKLAIGGVPFVTARANPLRQEALDYYRQVVDALGLEVRQYDEVVAVQPLDPGFEVTTRPSRAGDGAPARLRRTRALVVATGYFDTPNRLGVPGEDLPKVSHYFREPHPFYRQRVMVVGGRNSAVEAALELHRAGARVTLVHRREDLSDRIKPWILPLIRKRLEKGDVRGLFRTNVAEIRPGQVVLDGPEGRYTVENDFVFAMTGYRPDPSLLRRLGVRIDRETGAPDHDPETLETNVTGVYVAGVLAAGYNANRIFIENGRFHGERIVIHLLRKEGVPEEEARRRATAAAPALARTGESGEVEF